MHLLRARAGWILSFVIFVFCTGGADAHVTRVKILSRTDVLDGRAFGLAGAYEKIVGSVYFAVNPDNLHKVKHRRIPPASSLLFILARV